MDAKTAAKLAEKNGKSATPVFDKYLRIAINEGEREFIATLPKVEKYYVEKRGFEIQVEPDIELERHHRRNEFLDEQMYRIKF